jgi:tol-pal system protein YbgF
MDDIGSKHSTEYLGASLRLVVVGMLAVGLVAMGCVTPAEHRKLQRKLSESQRSGEPAADRGAVADLSADMQSLRTEIAELRGRVDVAEKKASDALRQASLARKEIARTRSDAANGEGAAAPAASGNIPDEAPAKEIQFYREAYASWRSGNTDTCIDQFRTFLQTYPSSPYADDAAYWMADCHFKKKDYRTAVLRFDDVVRKYPEGNKAPDALYRQGESLLKLGPGFGEAARRAFERVVKEYPNSARAPEASQQIELIDVG